MPRVESAMHTATGNERDCRSSCTDTYFRSNNNRLVHIRRCVARGSVAGSRDAQNVSSVVEEDGGQREDLCGRL